MEEYIVGPVLDMLIKNLSHYVHDQFKWKTRMKKELERLRENHPMIQAVLSTARRAQTIDQNSAFNKWIWQLRDAIDEAEDLLDDFEYNKHKKPTIRRNLIKVGKRALKIDHNLERLEEVVGKLDRVSAKVSDFLHVLESIKQEQREQHVELSKTRETGSLPRNDLIGRGKDKKSVIEWLSKSSNEEHQAHVATNVLYHNISILTIVGHGGMGKTTLMQHVYADEMTKEFDLKMWVCVSDSFDVKKVIADMLESINHSRPSLDSLDALQGSLKSNVMFKKFLLVLDDLWDKEEDLVCSKWENVLAPLANGGLGSKILITTRMDSIASMIAKVIRKKNESLRLDGLKEEECLQLLNTHAFADVENPDDHKKLRSICGELVKNLYGSPLAAKVMGGVLNSSLDERHWRNVLNSCLGHNDIFSILKLSYIFLPHHLQSCVSFCSIFEQDHVFVKDDLIRMWIAVGFIQSSQDNQGEALTLEDIGVRYFDVLIKKSFFDKAFNEDTYQNGYKMHDLLHELAQSISKQECFRFVGNEKSLFVEIPETIRHLSVETSNLEVLKKMERFKNLRTLLINCYDQSFVDLFDGIFKATRSIRLLRINYDVGLEVIPENIGYLHHLRYLRFPASFVGLLPTSLSSLYHLQFIIFNNHLAPLHHNDFFPRDMSNLSNLRYLSSLNLNFPWIGKLKFIQRLEFRIENKNGYRIEELEHMNELRNLVIKNLENVRDVEEASNAKLCDKRKLTDLSFEWCHQIGGIETCDSNERVLDNLQPHNNLKTLKITYYMGAKSAIWMNEAHLINNLEEIVLNSCLEWEILPPFGQLPFLKFLIIRDMRNVKRLENKFHGNDMCCVFPSLEKLVFSDLKELVVWFDASVFDNSFPCLTELNLRNCPNLQELPYLPPKLKSLKIYKLGWKTFNYQSILKSVTLKTFEVSDCDVSD